MTCQYIVTGRKRERGTQSDVAREFPRIIREIMKETRVEGLFFIIGWSEQTCCFFYLFELIWREFCLKMLRLIYEDQARVRYCIVSDFYFYIAKLITNNKFLEKNSFEKCLFRSINR